MSRAELTAWRRWLRAAGPWRLWAVCPCLSVGTIQPTPTIQPRVARLSIPKGLFDDGHTAVIVDIDPITGVAFAAAASHYAHAVLVLPRWPHAHAALPTDALAHTLVAYAKHLRAPLGDNVVFVLDGERHRPIRRRQDDARVDNRYELSASDLPNLHALRVAGIQRIVKLSAA